MILHFSSVATLSLQNITGLDASLDARLDGKI